MTTSKHFVEELRWRGMLHDIMPGAEEELSKGTVTAYLGIDPTADSLHIGHLVGVMMLKHLQQAGHRPIALIGGATGMIGDPSMKSAERNLLDEETLRHNQEAIGKQLSKFLDFDPKNPHGAILLNNYDWMKEFSFLRFIREIGKHITVNYMMAKDSVKRRLEANASNGLSFTEFSYQLLQGYDYLHLYKNYGCRLQMGGSDQWGNMTTGTELIRKIEGGNAFALTCPLIKKADGGKFGKTEQGNIWLDARYTSPYAFYQFWLNVSDEDAEKYIKIFTLLDRLTIEGLVREQQEAPHLRPLQKRLAEELTCMVHDREAYDMAVAASQILFGNSSYEDLQRLSADTLGEVFTSVPHYAITLQDLEGEPKLLDLLTSTAPIFRSKGELRKLIQTGGVSLNKNKLTDPEVTVSRNDLVAQRYLVVQKGKKNYFLLHLQQE